MSQLEAGDEALGGASVRETRAGDGAALAGDAVAIDQTSGQATPGDANVADASEFAGIAFEDFGDAGDDETVALTDRTVANVASGVSAGERLDLVDTSVTGAPGAGTLVASAGGPALALSDEGGTYRGRTLPAGYAVVKY